MTDVEVQLQVLKTKKLVCVQQEQSYGDISLELATMPSNAQG